jgi:PDZ domain-containing protein
MTQRTWAAVVAVPLFLVLGLYAAISPLPFVTFVPGPTLNVLGDSDGKPIITVQGHRTYRDDGELRMTTVSVTQRDARLDLLTLMRTWLSRHDAVYPFASQYGTGGSQQQDSQEGQVEMSSSQENATAAALTEAGYDVHPQLKIVKVTDGMPADGKLQAGDVLLRVGDTRVTSTTDVAGLLGRLPAGESVPVVVKRGDQRVEVELTPVEQDGHRLIGVQLSVTHRFPFTVSFNINDIGGPSAGLMFALSIYDLLTPGSLTDGQVVAGTGEIDDQGRVGEIGGIQQKIAGARADGAQLFLVPPANCADALGGDNGPMRLAKAGTLEEAVADVQAWTADHDAPLPSCRPDRAAS